MNDAGLTAWIAVASLAALFLPYGEFLSGILFITMGVIPSKGAAADKAKAERPLPMWAIGVAAVVFSGAATAVDSVWAVDKRLNDEMKAFEKRLDRDSGRESGGDTLIYMNVSGDDFD